jgi:hypothetical protein
MYNDFDKMLNSFEIGGESGPPKWGPWSKKNVNKRRAKRAKRKIKKNCGKPGCSRKGKGLV